MHLVSLTLVLLAATHVSVMIIVLARRKPGYRHWQHSISELGEIGAPDQKFVAYGVFLPVGIALMIAAAMLRSMSEPLAALAAAIAVGYVVAAFFPCDVGSPVMGSARQGMHNLGGAVQYAGGGFALLTLVESLGPMFKFGGFVVLAATVALTVFPTTSIRGLVQRVAEPVLFGLLAYGVWLIGRAA